jgi:hypothetical protein
LNEELFQSLRGKTADEVVEALVPEDWIREPSSSGGGVRFRDGKGNQVRIMPGYEFGDALHRGPYAVISLNGMRVRIPLAGNPALSADEQADC